MNQPIIRTIDQTTIEDFLRLLQTFYTSHGRHDMPWRKPEPDGSFDPYKILVSEIMLQQTQVSRVTPKYVAFLTRFPTVTSLAEASLGDVLQLWSGLGYNRRAKYLWQAAQTVQQECGGVFPATMAELQRLPGVGMNTAGAILAYAFDQPVAYIETNIRTVMIHHFFHDESDVSDAAIRDAMVRVVRTAQADDEYLSPREFYYALMDYGTHLKQTVGNLNRASQSYAKQSAFAGSRRQVRGRIVRLLAGRPYRASELVTLVADDRAEAVLDDLMAEGMIRLVDDSYSFV